MRRLCNAHAPRAVLSIDPDRRPAPEGRVVQVLEHPPLWAITCASGGGEVIDDLRTLIGREIIVDENGLLLKIKEVGLGDAAAPFGPELSGVALASDGRAAAHRVGMGGLAIYA
jgi:hypothetical protein